MSIVIVKPMSMGIIYDEAANIFQHMYHQVTGIQPVIGEDDQESDLVVIGSDAVNDFVMNEMFEGRISRLNIRYGTDDYCIRSYKKRNQNILLLAGGRGRSTLYAVYDYFERYAGCHYFWDGDIVPKMRHIQMEDIDVQESPRFEYRGLRYFAHRGLKRFQAEHWSFEDWKQEIAWMIKKRLNFFMLRIGMDDIWQTAFPEIVSYPEGYQDFTDLNGYQDRSDFWTLKFRGELRKKVLQYARDMDLMYPVDCGTMTHWYSKTPSAYLEKKNPTFLPQVSQNYYFPPENKVFDFRIKENMDAYMRLTETMVEEYDKRSDLFHTIGLGERTMYADRQKNFDLKLFTYRRMSENLRQRYPNSKLMLASWDFFFCWQPEEVQQLIKELDPERTIIMDYTADGTYQEKNFVSWDIVGKFPWIFGLFHAGESDNEIRGNYAKVDEKLKIAADDPFCKGMIFWPELSHSDSLALEYLTQNAWSPLEKNIEEIAQHFCNNRYGNWANQMNDCWQKLLPLIQMGSWNTYQAAKWCKFTDVMKGAKKLNSEQQPDLKPMLDLKANIESALVTLSTLGTGLDKKFILRDSVDLIRTVLGRYLNLIIEQTVSIMEKTDYITALEDHYMNLLQLLGKVLTLNNDFSVYQSLKELEKVAPVNPRFEVTLKKNIYNYYCWQGAYELVQYIYLKEGQLVFDWIKNAETGTEANFAESMEAITKCYMETPLADMQPAEKYSAEILFTKVADAVQNLNKFLQHAAGSSIPC